jgi:hypothetical protein
MPSHGSLGPSKEFQTQAPNIIWIQRKGAQMNLIRDAPSLEPSFICLSKVPVNESPPGSPTGAPMERVAHFQSPPSSASQKSQ